MNSFQIKQAKAELLRIVQESPEHSLGISEAIDALREAGHRVNEDALRVLVEGSAQPVLAFAADQKHITLLTDQ